jgi:hypothetical protein
MEEVKFIKLTDTRYLRLSYYNNTNYKLELISEVMAVLDSYSFSSSYVDSNTVSYKAITRISDTKAIAVFSDTYWGYALMLDFTSDNITVPNTTAFSEGETSELAIEYLSSNTVIVGYVKSSEAFVQVLNYYGNTITANMAYENAFNSSGGSYATTFGIVIKRLTNTTAIMSYSNYSADQFEVTILSISNKTITTNKKYILENRYCNLFGSDLFVLDSEHVIFCFAKSSDTYLIFGIFTINGTTLSHGNNIIISDIAVIARIAKISDTLFVVAFKSYAGIQFQLVSYDENYTMSLETKVDGADYNYFNLLLIGSKIYYTFPSSNTVNSYGYLDNFSIGERTDKEAIWINNKTKILANFEQNLNCGNISYQIDGIRIKRLAEDGNFYITIADLENSVSEYVDTTARNDINYTYLLTSVDEDGNEDSGVEATSILDFWGWFLTDGINIYKFDAQNKSNVITTNRAMTVSETYSQYPTINFGNKNYRTSTLSTVPYIYNTEYEFTYGLLEELRAFINNETIKYLKNTKGEIIQVITSNFSYQYMDETREQAYEITFDWVEVGVGEDGL